MNTAPAVTISSPAFSPDSDLDHTIAAAARLDRPDGKRFRLVVRHPDMRRVALIHHRVLWHRRVRRIRAGNDAEAGEHLRLQFAVRVFHLGADRQAMGVAIHRGAT